MKSRFTAGKAAVNAPATLQPLVATRRVRAMTVLVVGLAMTLGAGGVTAQQAAYPYARDQTGSTHAVSNRPDSDIVLSIGRGTLVNVGARMADVFIADDTIADVKVKSQTQIYLFAKSGGETTIYASGPAGEIVWSANVRVGSNLDSVDQMLRLAMPEADIMVATMNNTILLTGTVAAPEDAAEAERLVIAFSGQGVNVISRLKIASPLQVSLHVRFAEVNRTLVREMNANLITRDRSGGFLFGIQRGNNTGAIKDVTGLPLVDASSRYNLPAGTISLPFDPRTGKFVVGGANFEFPANRSQQTALNLAGQLLGLDVNLGFDLAERIGLISTLSEPNLTALSGETASFLAGGEYPIPISQGLGTTTIEYRDYGVSLAYTPTVLTNGRISLRVRPEVSELSQQGAVVIDGFQIPALTIRRAETTVELGSGQSFMIAGLLSNGTQQLLDKTPGAANIPIIGSLFKSTSFQKGETELVIVVTPYLVKPVDAKDIALPTDGYQTATEAQRILRNVEHDGVSLQRRPTPQSDLQVTLPAPTQ
ncbi:type II and III secretion system protein family protein [Croceicoccus sp. F390]|uniref:Type II and III secretion system protein family protein n=1 Tax=Croceicoccus esteveae TaxID=3075597 RepID=A0ABU2ZGI2_9SPHN|nr:type II and III secretion system protein family protein [Croceicoccus sp. F390]MDT0575692.1 type II and III secretion system protein family protein [Croceicoccus sp. F390]